MTAPAPVPAHAPSPAEPHGGHAHPTGTWALTLAALGVVYGDIGTSPLYTLAECTTGVHGIDPSKAEHVLGALSLIFWSLIMVVTVKYLMFIMRADNRGEGGILALLALVPEKLRKARPGRVSAIALLVVVGAALLYGDGIITPAISVLSAVEGLKYATHALEPVVLPITCGILLGLFALQQRGTGGIGRLFAPIMIVWFTTIGLLGIVQIVKNPSVAQAILPHHAVRLFIEDFGHSFRLLGSVVLAVTGGEALYADMGHFGVGPIRRAWLGLVLPALLLSYFGQGALLLRHPDVHPFFGMVPQGLATYLLVGLATMATVIASQALISGAFSLTHQAVQLGYFPRVTIKHTSHETEGQIYIPEINWGLAIACIVLVLSFRESTKIAAAYGIAVSGTMAITSIVFYVVAVQTWGWSRRKAVPLLCLFLLFDLAFLSANLLKFVDGGYVPVLVGAAFVAVMVIWKMGRTLLAEYYASRSPAWSIFMRDVDETLIERTPGTAVFMASSADGVPPLLVHHARRIRVLHERVLLTTVMFGHVPTVAEAERLEVEELGKGFYRVVGHYGFMQEPNVPELIALASGKLELGIQREDVTYYLGRETFLATDAGKMGRWTETIFAFLSRNARSATAYFGIPPEQVIEMGTQIDL